MRSVYSLLRMYRHFFRMLMFLTADGAFAQEFEIWGTLRYQVKSRGELTFETNKNYYVALRGCKWAIRTSSIDLSSYVETCYEDGTMYRLGSYNKSTNGQPVTTLSGSIDMRDFPKDDATQINYLWLAYASSCYFDAQTNNFLEPIWLLDDPNLANEHFKMQATWSRTSDERLPREVAYLNDGYYRIWEEGRGRMVFKVPAPYNQGFTQAIYSATSVTNLGKCIIPLSFNFTRFQVNEGNGKTALLVRTSTEGMVTDLKTNCSRGEFRPAFSGVVAISDRRFPVTNSPAVRTRYAITNGVWPEVLAATHNYKAAVKQAARASAARELANKPSAKRGIAVGMLMFILFIPLLIVVINKIRTKKPN